MTRLQFINVVLFQWFFVRLAKVVDSEGAVQRYTFIGFILPLTGWRSNFVWLHRF